MTDPRGPADSASDLPRELGLFDSVSIVLGIVIGAGIFLMPNLVARAMGSAGWIFAAWIFTGALSFFGALAFAELGAMLPATGGQYVYLREAWGSLAAFLCGWSHFLISQSAGIAYLSVSFAIYLSYFLSVGTMGRERRRRRRDGCADYRELSRRPFRCDGAERMRGRESCRTRGDCRQRLLRLRVSLRRPPSGRSRPARSASP